MKTKGRWIAFYLPVVGLLTACDTFAPPPKRGPTTSPPPTSTIIKRDPTAPTPSATTATQSVTQPTSGECIAARIDRDGDGVTVPMCPTGEPVVDPTPALSDCDDLDPTRHVSRELFADDDADGLGNGAVSQWVCEGVRIEGFVDNDADCSDTNPAGQEWVTYDMDGDGFGGSNSVCGRQGAGWVNDGGDCNDKDPGVHPEASEVAYDGLDANCDYYDVAVFAVEEPGPVLTWTEGALCSGGVLAIVGLDRGTQPPGGVFLQIGNIGSEVVTDATLVLTGGAPFAAPYEPRQKLPPLAPGEVVRTELLDAGQYEATFEYGTTTSVNGSAAPSSTSVGQTEGDAAARTTTPRTSVDAGAVTAVKVDAGTPDASQISSPVDARAAHLPDATATSSEGDGARCTRAQEPFTFSSSRVEP